MALTVAQIQVMIGANASQLQQVLNQSQQMLVNFQQKAAMSIRQAGVAIASFGAAIDVGLTAPLVGLIKQGSELERLFQTIQANTGMTAAEFAEFKDVVTSLGANVGAPFEQIANGFMRVHNFGFQGAEAVKVLQAAMESAVATGADTGKTAQVLAATLHQFGLNADYAAGVLDILKVNTQAGNLTLEEMVGSMGRLLGTAASLGADLPGTISAFSALTASGRTAAQATTDLSGFLVKLVNPSKQAREEIQRLSKQTGIDLVSDFSQAGLKSKGFEGILNDLKGAVGNNTGEILKLIPALRGGIGAMVLMSTGFADFQSRMEKVHQVLSGKLTPTMDAFKDAQAALAVQSQVLDNRLQLLGFTLEQAFKPTIAAGAEILGQALLKLTGFLQALPPQILAVGVAMATMTSAAGAVLTVVGGLIALLGGPLTLALVAITAQLAVFAGAFALNFQRILDMVKAWTGQMGISFRQVAVFFGMLADAFAIGTRIIIGEFDLIVTAAVAMGRAIVDIFAAIRNNLTGIVVSLATGDMVGLAQSLLKMNSEAMGRIKADLVSQFGSLASRIASDARSMGSHLGGEFANAFGSAFDSAADFAKKMPSLADGAKAMLDQIKGATGDAANAIKGHSKEAETALNDVVGRINNYLQAIGSGMTLTKEAYQAMSESARTHQRAMADEWAQTTQKQSVNFFQLLTALDSVGKGISETFVNGKLVVKENVDQIVAETTKLNTALTNEGDVAKDVSLANQVALANMMQAYIHSETAIERSLNQLVSFWESEDQKLGLTTTQTVEDILSRFGALRAKLPAEAQATMDQFIDTWIKGLAHTGKLTGEWADQINGYIEHLRDSIGKPLGELVTQITVNFAKFIDKSLAAVSDWAGKIGAVIQTMPGKFGDAARGVLRSVNDWIAFANSILAVLNKVFGSSIPDSLAGMLTKIVNIFHKAKDTQKESIDDMLANYEDWAVKGTDSANKAATGISGAVGKIAGALSGLGLIISGMHQGGLGGGLQGALGGLMTGAIFGPIGAIVGGIGGFFAGLFGHKSSAQKQAEQNQLEEQRLQLEKMKQDLQKGAQEVVQTALETMQKAMETLEKLADFTKVPRATIKAFFKNLNQILAEFIDLAGKWGKDLLDKAKTFAEDMQPGIAMIGTAVESLTAMGAFIAPARSTVQQFFQSLSDVVDFFGQLAEETPNKLEKHIKKFANRIGGAIELIGPAVEGFARFADRAGAVANLIKTAVDALSGVTAFQSVPAEAFDTLFAAIKTAIQKMQDLAANLDTDMLTRAEAIATKSMAVFSAIKAGVEALSALRDYKGVADTAIQALVDDFAKAIQLLNMLLNSAIEFEDLAMKFEDHINKGAAAFSRALSTFTSTFTGAVSVLGGVQGGTVTIPGGAGSQSVSSATWIHLDFSGMSVSADVGRGTLALEALDALLRAFGMDLPQLVRMRAA